MKNAKTIQLLDDLIQTAADLTDIDNDSVEHREYTRGQAELIGHAVGISSEHNDRIVQAIRQRSAFDWVIGSLRSHIPDSVD